MGYEDAPREQFEVTCADCGVETTVPFKPTGERPVKCRDCFQKDRPPRREGAGGGGRGGDRPAREEFEVTCADCGVETTVPFKPTGERPVKCRDCFQKDRPPRREGGGGGRSGGFGGSAGGRGGDREMHSVNCTRCGTGTQVPFKPTPGREVLCNECFRK
jgi:CxxC-x17-CxxC domain-containing protein